MPPPSSALEAGAHAVVVAALLFGLGFALTGIFAARLGLTLASRLALAVPSTIGAVALVMVAHIGARGAVLSRPGYLRAVVAALVVVAAVRWWRGRARGTRPAWERDAAWAAALVLVAIAVWCLPAFTNLPLSFHGDVKRHMAWAAQLASGHSTPTGVITGEVPNYYPWLFHALTAFTAAFTPGGRVLHALGPLQILAAVGAVLAFFGLGRELFATRAAAVAAALLGALSGGFGFFIARGPALVTDPRAEGEALRFGGDLMMLRSYNLSFHNLSPPFPRDFGFVLLVAMLLLLTIGIKRRSAAPFVGAGVALGLIGLTTGESLIVGALLGVVLIALGPGISRPRALAALFGPALALYAIWLVPLALNYVRLGGFADTAGDPITLPAPAIVFSWGIAVPFAVVGMAAWRRWPSPARVVIASAVAAAVVAVAGANLAPLLGEGFTTLGRHHRYWPLVYIGVALLGALGAETALRYLGRFHRVVAGATAALVVGAALASPLLGSIAMSRQPVENDDLAAALRGEPSNVLEVLAQRGGACSVAVPNELSRSVPAHTGARLVYFAAGTGNQAGIRWPLLPDPIPDEMRAADNRALLGAGDDEEWGGALERYDLDAVVVPAERSLPPVASDYHSSAAEGEARSYRVVWTAPCS